jgi:hypothetical protein
MKTVRKKFLQITFLLVVAFFYGITMFSSYHIQHLYSISTDVNIDNSIECSDYELVEDVQIAKNENNLKFMITYEKKILFKKLLFAHTQPSFSIWQPPKLI